MEKDFYWLNAKSRTFLERGYLKLNQTAEERIKEIAIFAERTLEISDFASKFENFQEMECGDEIERLVFPRISYLG